MYCSIRNIEFSGIIDEKYIGEVILDGTKYTLSEILDVSKKYNRVVYDLSEVLEIADTKYTDFKMLIDVADNIVFRTGSLEHTKELLDRKLPVFMAPNNLTVADSHEKLIELAESGISDVYIGGEIAFRMPLVASIAKEYQINIRLIPNMASVSGLTGWFGQKRKVNSFWVRPEDLDLYKCYVDYVEFAGDNSKQHVLYDIYFETKKWLGDLSQIVDGLEEVDNRGLTSAFTEGRLNCRKRCLLSQCHSCFRHKALGDLIVENKLEVDFEESI